MGRMMTGKEPAPPEIEGWTVRWTGPRTVHLQKDTEGFRRHTGAPGFVETTGSAETPRADILQSALAVARTNDELIALKTAIPERTFAQLLLLRDAMGEGGDLMRIVNGV